MQARVRCFWQAGFLMGLALAPLAAQASCGAAFCPVNTHWEVQGPWQDPGLRADLRFEFLDQDQPRHGRRRVGVGEVAAHHDEVRTINRNWVLGLDYSFDSRWGVALTLPFVRRDHRHLHHHGSDLIPESWDISALGDLRLLGAVYRGAAPAAAWSWFSQAMYQRALAEHGAYRPGYRVSLDLGLRYAASDALGLLLQLNGQLNGRDRGAEGVAEPEDSGGEFVFLSPGVSYAVTPQLQFYGFVQEALYQRVNGVQLTADRGYVVGLSARF